MEFKHLLRVANTDLDGNKKIVVAMKKIKGVDIMLANAICQEAGIDTDAKAGDLSDSDAEKLTKALNDANSKLPNWLLNRRKDPETGQDLHIIGPELGFTKEGDLKRLKKIKSNRGFRHQWGLPVRGQRTKANFRRNKGRGSLGVNKKK